MTSRSFDHKDVRRAYTERQKVLDKKDFRKGKIHHWTKMWKTSKGYGTKAGRAADVGRNYGRQYERPWYPKAEGKSDAEVEDEDADTKDDECETRAIRGKQNALRVDFWNELWLGSRSMEWTFDESFDFRTVADEMTEQEALDLARALSISLATATAQTSVDEDWEIDSRQSEFDGDVDEYSFMGTESEATDTDWEYETDGSDGSEWIEVTR